MSAVAVETSAEEVIDRIKKLPPNELQTVKLFLQGYVEPLPRNDSAGERVASDADFKKASDEVFSQFDGLLKRLAK